VDEKHSQGGFYVSVILFAQCLRIMPPSAAPKEWSVFTYMPKGQRKELSALHGVIAHRPT
jgi:hypothetical protein